jgi:hypothetical protein
LSIKIVICISEESGAICRRVYIDNDYEKNKMAFEMVSTSNAAHILRSSPDIKPMDKNSDFTINICSHSVCSLILICSEVIPPYCLYVKHL